MIHSVTRGYYSDEIRAYAIMLFFIYRGPNHAKSNIRVTRTLWEPFREVLPDHELDNDAKVLEDCSEDDVSKSCSIYCFVTRKEVMCWVGTEHTVETVITEDRCIFSSARHISKNR